MMTQVLLDAGPLVAYLDRRDQFHPWAREMFGRIQAPLLTCEAVLTESFHLLRKTPGCVPVLMDMLTRGAIAIPFRLSEEVANVKPLLRRYANLPMSLADACLVRMSEQHGHSTVFTLDRHFKIYRRHGRQVVPAIMPSE